MHIHVFPRGSSLFLWLSLSLAFGNGSFGPGNDRHGFTPTSVHISLSGTDALTCVWYTRSVPPGTRPYCEYGSSADQLHLVARGTSYSYSVSSGGFAGSLHEVRLVNVTVASTVYYRCRVDAWNAQWSELFNATLQSHEDILSSPSLGIVLLGDMGVDHSKHTMSAMQKAMLSGMFGRLSLMVHAGDISYADDRIPPSKNFYIWVEYFENLQPLAAYLPYMTCPGNHESQFNFTAYQNWLRMPTKGGWPESPFYYSFDYLGVHFVMMSTEHDFSPGSVQHRWLEKDLFHANKNRRRVPWVVVVGHRPLYCSSWLFASRCVEEAALYRSFLEDLFFWHHVDVYLCGHNHQYERSYPVYKGFFLPSYVSPPSTVYIVNGAAGNIEGNDPSHMKQASVPWRAAHSNGLTAGFMVMTPLQHNLSFVFVESQSGQVIDRFTIVK